MVVDNLNIHRCKSLTDTFGKEVGSEIWDRFTIHYTPKPGSWLESESSQGNVWGPGDFPRVPIDPKPEPGIVE
jgi:hypothetical protein